MCVIRIAYSYKSEVFRYNRKMNMHRIVQKAMLEMIQGKTTCRYCVDYMAWEKGHRKFHVMLRVNVRKNVCTVFTSVCCLFSQCA